MSLLRPFLCMCLFAAPASGPTLAASPVAEVVCDSSERLQQRLQRRLGAQRRASGLRSPEEMMEVWTDDRGGWTLVMRHASGTSCIVAMGSDWREAPVARRDPA